jgi:hypothetical protein
MSELLGVPVKTHGLWHAGSYDPQDFLGRLIGPQSWVVCAEMSYFYAFDHNYFATEFHVELFMQELLNGGFKGENPYWEEDWANRYESGKIVKTGWPMEYMQKILKGYRDIPKRDLILFPHRIAPEKQVDIFRDLAKQLPQYDFVVCQDHQLSKHEYHTLLAEAKMVFSANLQETLGISCYEGALVDAIPMVPDRLSYSEMYYDTFKYASEWTESFESYQEHKKELCDTIINHMENYDKRVPLVRKQAIALTEQFFSADKLLKNIDNPA